jgi:FMN-dependent oxidoreductase (nitrilotriacetate monooxygenase family)
MMRKLHFGLFIYPGGHHLAGWRHPSVTPKEILGFEYYKRAAVTAERGLFDLYFVGDMLAAREREGRLVAEGALNNIDSISIDSAVAGATRHIGVVATLSTTYNEPYAIAERFASLDHISGGRSGWNIVTTANDDAALNFSRKTHMEKTLRYQRAKEFVDVCTGLWDSWADDAFIRDVENGVYFDPARMHVLDHKGPHFSVRGPLNIARPVQGWPVIVQAGASEAGRQIAAETAEMVFAAGGPMADAQRFYADVKGRMEAAGRNRDHMKILPGALVVVGETMEEARRKRDLLDSLVHPDSGMGSLSIALGCDASQFDLDGPLPEIPETNQSKSSRQRVVDRARRDNLTVRQLAQIAGGYGGLSFTGTPQSIADQMEEWLLGDACDGFNVMFPYVPGGLDDFVDMVVPELQRRGLFRTEYEGKTLRENLGLPRPANRFFAVG